MKNLALNGDETRVREINIPKDEPNCVVVTTFIKGKGVVKLGGIVVGHRGRGWLGLEITVDARRMARVYACH